MEEVKAHGPAADLAALPESYATAWTCLFVNLGLEPGQTLLIRGATSALGQAAVNLAAHAGARATLPLFLRLVPPARTDGLAAGAGRPPVMSVADPSRMYKISVMFVSW